MCVCVLYGGRERGGDVVAFYEPPTSELGQPRPRAPRNHGGAWGSGSNGIFVTDTQEREELHGVCVLRLRSKGIVVDLPLASGCRANSSIRCTVTSLVGGRIALYLSRADGITNHRLYFRRYISVMYSSPWYGNQHFPTCTYDAARGVFLTSPSGSPNSTAVFLPLPVSTRIPTHSPTVGENLRSVLLSEG